MTAIILNSMSREQINLFLIICALILPSNLFAQSNNTDFQIGKRALEEHRLNYARTYLESALKDGCCEANYYLGRIYAYESENENAIKFYKAGAECGDPKSMVAISHYSYMGISTETIANYLQKACAQKYGEAYKQYALLFYENDAQTKLNYLKIAETLGADCSKEIAACYYYDKNDYDSVIHYASRAIFTIGNRHDCIYYLGMAYYYKGDYKKSIEWLSFFCRVELWCSHKSRALYYLGKIYEKGGHGVIKDIDKAKQLYNYSAFHNGDCSKESKIRLLEIAKFGDMSEEECIKLIPYLIDVYNDINNSTFKDKMSALIAQIERDKKLSPSNRSAAKNFATAYLCLNGSEKDTINAIECYKTAINQGSIEAITELGRLMLKLKKKEAHEYLIDAATSGSINSSFLLYDYYREIVLPSDGYYYAIHQSITEAKLHDIEENQLNGEIDNKKVADLYYDAYCSGILFSINNQYNDTLYEELIFPPNSLYYNTNIRKTYHDGPLSFISTLDQAICYYYKAENYEKAYNLYKSCIEHTELGELYGGLCFYHKRGAPKTNFDDTDESLGLEMIEDAAKRDNPTAMLILGNILRKNNQYDEAVHWYRIASYYGNCEAMRNLALCYHKGLGTDVNEKLANEWLKISKELGGVNH